MCVVWFGLWRNDKQEDLLSSEAEHLEGIGGLEAISVESNSSSAGYQALWHLRPSSALKRIVGWWKTTSPHELTPCYTAVTPTA
jgi:hypothetical protein